MPFWHRRMGGLYLTREWGLPLVEGDMDKKKLSVKEAREPAV